MSWLSNLLKIDIDLAEDWLGLEGDEASTANTIAGLLGGSTLLAASGLGRGSTQNMGYQGTIPKYQATRERVANTYDPLRRPGSGGQRYFTDMQYTPVTEDTVAPTPTTAEGLEALNLANLARQTRPVAAATDTTDTTADSGTASKAASSVIDQVPVPVYDAEGNVIQMAAGGIAALKKGKYIDGATDGMADRIPANIDGVQEAALSDGEFVIPADVVSHLGNGNSDAGAKVLTKMMARVREVRTGNDKQAKQIDSNKFLPV
jgi:hypothetical protein